MRLDVCSAHASDTRCCSTTRGTSLGEHVLDAQVAGIAWQQGSSWGPDRIRKPGSYSGVCMPSFIATGCIGPCTKRDRSMHAFSLPPLINYPQSLSAAVMACDSKRYLALTQQSALRALMQKSPSSMSSAVVHRRHRAELGPSGARFTMHKN